MTFEELKQHFGSVVKAHRRLKLGSRQTLYNWRDRGIPISAQIRIQSMTRGKLRARLPRGFSATTGATE